MLLDGRMIAQMPTAEVAKQMAILPQGPQAPAGLTVEELVSYGRYPHQKGFGRLDREDREAIRWALHITHMEELAGKILTRSPEASAKGMDSHGAGTGHPGYPSGRAHHLSGYGHQLEVLRLLEKLNRLRKKTIALVIHDLNLAARFSHRLIAMRSGKILHEGTPEEVMTPQVLEEVFFSEGLYRTGSLDRKAALYHL